MRVKEGNKREDIIKAAIKVFAKNGFYNAKISKIAETANVAAGSVYLYFKNKEDILYQIFTEIWEELNLKLKNIADSKTLSPIEKVNSIIDSTFDVFESNPALGIVFVNEQNHVNDTWNDFIKYYDSFLDLGETVIKEGIKKKIFYSDINVSVFRFFVFGGIRHSIQTWAKNPKAYSLTDFRNGIKELINNGIVIRSK
ncbi:MAG: TetR/AcrR family transcriptional regulator [Melioribacteraceae bacterium]|jgi:TetR/AcrR family fatty acid metabolism transcriptional regulator|nr:TetR/AcrR family transcriptional regulator [Melioribacteraceae bacterium]